MWTLDKLKSERDAMKSARDFMQKHAKELTAKIAKLQADQSLKKEYVDAKIGELRAETWSALGAVSAPSKMMQNGAAAVRNQERFWSDKRYLLSLERFNNESAAADSAIRARYQSELSKMDVPLLQLVADDAVAERNLPLIWQAMLADGGRVQQAAGGDYYARGLVDLERLEIPNQKEALALIQEVSQLHTEATIAVGQVSGRLKPAEVLDLVRAA